MVVTPFIWSGSRAAMPLLEGANHLLIPASFVYALSETDDPAAALEALLNMAVQVGATSSSG